MISFVIIAIAKLYLVELARFEINEIDYNGESGVSPIKEDSYYRAKS